MSRTLLAAFATLLIQQVASASPVYVGSWTVDQGLDWTDTKYQPTGPLAYTGQEAAALLFGGSPSDYAISTVDKVAANIDHMAWYSVIGYVNAQGNGSLKMSESYSSKYLDKYYGPSTNYPVQDPSAAASTYVKDYVLGEAFTNYAFRVSNGAVLSPEPASITMFGVMLVSGAIALRRRNLTAKA